MTSRSFKGRAAAVFSLLLAFSLVPDQVLTAQSAMLPVAALARSASFTAGAVDAQGFALATRDRARIAAVQYPVESGLSLDDFLAKVERMTDEAVAGGANVVMFPELHVLDLVNYRAAASEGAQLARIAEEVTPVIFDDVVRMAREKGVMIIGGSSPRVTPRGIVNTSIVAFPDGRTVLQDKLFLTPDEVAWGWTTGQELKVFRTPWGRASVLICYDAQFSKISEKLAALAPEAIFVPSMTGANGYHRVRWASQARAVEHHAYVAVTGTVEAGGPLSGVFTGQAAFLTPRDRGFAGLLAEGVLNRSEIVFADLDFAFLRTSRARAGLYSARDSRRRSDPVRVVLE